MGAEKKNKGFYTLTGGACASKYCQFATPLAGGKTPLRYKDAVVPAYVDPAKPMPHRLLDFGKLGVNFKINYRDAGLPVYIAMSKLLPKWVCLYLTPMSSHVNEFPTIAIPVMLNRGEAMVLVESDASTSGQLASGMEKP